MPRSCARPPARRHRRVGGAPVRRPAARPALRSDAAPVRARRLDPGARRRDRQRGELRACSAAVVSTEPSIGRAGREILAECRLLGGCETGTRRRPPAAGCRQVGHPHGRPGLERRERGEPELLASAHRRSLEVAAELGARRSLSRRSRAASTGTRPRWRLPLPSRGGAARPPLRRGALRLPRRGPPPHVRSGGGDPRV